MILWLTGQSQSGKTTLARKLAQGPWTVILDGDELRAVWNDLDMSVDCRWEQNIRVAKLAKMLESQGFTVIVAVICPFKKLRNVVKEITDCDFIYVEGGITTDNAHPYEVPENPLLISKRSSNA